MASEFIKQKLTEAAKLSPSFQGLPLAKQAELISSLENSSDQQILEAITAFEDDLKNLQDAELARKQAEQKLTATAQALEDEIKSTSSEMDKMSQAEENSGHLSEIDELEKQMDKLNAPTPKRKKFLGLF